MLARLFASGESIKNDSLVLFPERRKILLQIEEAVSELMVLSDFVPLRVALATYVANFLNQIPLWITIVAPPSSGKTEILGCLYKLPHVQVVSDLSKSSLLSGTPQKDQAKNKTGGLLLELGDFGFLVFKDMTTSLAKNKDAEAELFTAFREIYDGDYYRHFGSDGGTHKEWHGRLGVIAGVTPEIEKHRTVSSSLGDRFLTVKIYKDDDESMEQSFKALESSGSEHRIRRELQELAALLFQGIEPDTDLPKPLLRYIHQHITPLAAFVASCRTPVEHAFNKEIEFIHQTEGYARLAKQLFGLFCGSIAIGCSLEEAWNITVRVGMDSVPEQRSQVLEAFILHGRGAGDDRFSLNQLRPITRLSTRMNQRIVDELYAVGVLEQERSSGCLPSEYWLSGRTQEQIDAICLKPQEPDCFPGFLEDPIPSDSHIENGGSNSDEHVNTCGEGVDHVA